MASCEDNVGIRLERSFRASPDLSLLSYHPPSAKCYEYDAFPIPILREGTIERRSKGRDHVDLIVCSASTLLLIELKCRSSESGVDVEKLLNIRATYGLPGILKIIRSRLTTLPTSVLDDVTELALAIGVEKADAPIMEGIGLVAATENKIEWVQLPSLSESTAGVLAKMEATPF